MAVVLLFIFSQSAVAQGDFAPAASPAACSALKGFDFSGIKDAPTQITDVRMVPTSKDGPAYCLLEGYVSPQVGLQVRMPVAHWNGKLMAVGNGGWAGSFNDKFCYPNLKQGYACVTTDTGHKGSGHDGLWAVNNLAAQVDFGFRAVHVSAVAAKSIVATFYGKGAQKSYFMSCSTGGYEGLVEAQRFPWDFDGIIAGDPDMDEADATARMIWIQRSLFGGTENLGATAKPVLDAKALNILHQAVLAQCDMNDGVKDGLIGNAMACNVDPAKLLCKNGKSEACLSAAQVEAAKRIYEGPPHSSDRPLVRGPLPGSELLWGNMYGTDTGYADSLFKYMIYGASPGWTSASYDFEHDYTRLGLAALYSDTNPDLRRFKAAGGKLIVYQGSNDVLNVPGPIVDY